MEATLTNVKIDSTYLVENLVNAEDVEGGGEGEGEGQRAAEEG